MEIRDFEKKMKYAMDFYDQATEIQHMVQTGAQARKGG